MRKSSHDWVTFCRNHSSNGHFIDTVEKMSFCYVRGERDRAEQDGLLCVACKEPLVDPQVHLPCRAMACKACFARTLHCPDCQGELHGQLTVTARLVTTRLDALQVHCPTCQVAAARSELMAHVVDCPRPCPRGCGAQVRPAEDHDAVCGAIATTCPAFGCTAKLARSDLQAHQEECPLAAVEPATRALLAGLAITQAQIDAIDARALLAGLALMQAQIDALDARVAHRKRGRPRAELPAAEPAKKRLRSAARPLAEQNSQQDADS
jgi:hypothetical protein